MQISTDVFTHAIITFTKSHHLITSRQHDAIKAAGIGDSVGVNGSIIKMSNVAEVLTIQKYYETHPAQKPITYEKAETQQREIYGKARSLKALKSIKTGLLTHALKTNVTVSTQLILDKIDMRIKLIEKTPENKVHLASNEIMSRLM